MSISIQETFQVQAPIERVWQYLTDPRQVVQCLPGAELSNVESPTAFLGRVKVKVGPIVASYDGKVTMVERDDDAHVVRMVAEGRETSGTGSAKMTMTNSLVAVDTPDGPATEVRVVAEVDVVGRLAQFGRGMIESVNKQLFKQFTTCVKGTLEIPITAETSTGPVTAPAPGPATAPAADNGAVTTAATPVLTAFAPPVAMTSAPARPVRVLPLVFRAILDWLRRSVGSRPGRKEQP